jgi:GDP-4-dehydro-6-deoxy-D-mannose reductase
MKRAFVTGHSGFTGRHLVSHLRAGGYSVFGFDRSEGGDIRDSAAIARVVQATQPTVVFHLAATLRSQEPQHLYSVNVEGTVALLEALTELETPPVVVIVSSSAVYGRTPSGRPVSERAPLRPQTHYGASKLAQEQVAMRYFHANGLSVIRARAFNLLGPGLPTTLACGSFVDAVARLERTDTPERLRTGNLSSARDFTDIRDVVRAYALLAEKGRAGSVYNVCSGTAVSLQHCLDVLLRLAARPIALDLDPALIQPNDVKVQVGDGERLRALTQWRPVIPVEQSLADMLDLRRQKDEE